MVPAGNTFDDICFSRFKQSTVSTAQCPSKKIVLSGIHLFLLFYFHTHVINNYFHNSSFCNEARNCIPAQMSTSKSDYLQQQNLIKQLLTYVEIVLELKQISTYLKQNFTIIHN
jgi:flagellar biosynthesis protein FliP